MAKDDIVVYWHKLGLKVYRVINTPELLKDINSTDLVETEKQLKFLAGTPVYLLLDDSISYLLTKDISPPISDDSVFRKELLSQIKSEVPQDFEKYPWDYLIEKTTTDTQTILIIAPAKDFLIPIDTISKNLLINYIAIESKSISLLRDPDPIIGITQKNSLLAPVENTTNTVVVEAKVPPKNYLAIFILIFIFLNIIGAWVYFEKPVFPTKTKNVSSLSTTPTPDIVLLPTIKPLSGLTIVVQNGTTKSGYASTIATKLKDLDINQVDIGNANADNYEQSKLVFKDSILKDKYLQSLTKVVPVESANISVDSSLTADVKIILGVK
jgi:hypothetical protein